MNKLFKELLVELCISFIRVNFTFSRMKNSVDSHLWGKGRKTPGFLSAPSPLKVTNYLSRPLYVYNKPYINYK